MDKPKATPVRRRTARAGAQASNVVQFPKLKLVPQAPCHDTIEVLSLLLEEARAGTIIGVAMVAMHKQRCYEFALTGEAARSPTFALGTITVLQGDLVKRIAGPKE